MPWIESHTVLLRHRKVIEIAKELELKPVYILGHLHALWHAALEQQEDGDLSAWSDETIAEMAAFDGSPTGFVEVLHRHKFLENRILHDWLDYAGKYLAAKYRTSNPKRLRDILRVHESVHSRSKVGKKSTQDAIRLSSHKVLKEGEESLREEEIYLLPDWLPKKEWNEFVANRKRKRAPITESITRRIIGVLDELRKLGYRPADVLNEAVDRNWTAIKVDWIHKGSQNGNYNAKPSEPKGFAAIHEILKGEDEH